MSDWFAIEAVDEAIDDTKELLTPFNVRKWATMAAVVMFTGGLGGVRSLNVIFRLIGGIAEGVGEAGSTMQTHQTSLAVNAMTGMLSSTQTSVLVGLALLFVLLFVVVWMFVGAVMNFVFVDICRNRDIGILGYFGSNTGKGLSYMVFMIVMFVVLIATILSPAALLLNASSDISGMTAAGAVGIVIYAILAFLSFGIVMNITRHFVVVKMIEKDEGIIKAWKMAFWTLKNHWAQLVVFLLVQVGLGVAIGIALSIFWIVAVLVFVLIGTILTALAIFAGPAGIAVALLLGLPLVLVFFLLMLFVRVPFTTYMRYFSIRTYEKLFSAEVVA